jgi:hypothetical protein
VRRDTTQVDEGEHEKRSASLVMSRSAVRVRASASLSAYSPKGLEGRCSWTLSGSQLCAAASPA